jgi:hypothetical protein
MELLIGKVKLEVQKNFFNDECAIVQRHFIYAGFCASCSIVTVRINETFHYISDQ